MTPANAAGVRARCARDADKDLDVPHSPVSSQRRNVLGLSKGTWWRLTKQEKLHPYKIIRSHRLEPQDYPRRLTMCRYLVTLSPADLSNILFSDEAQFYLDGTINTQNVRRYAPRKGSLPANQRQGRPNHFRHRKSTFSSHIMVFLGLRGDGTLFGYSQIQGSLNSQMYHTLLQNRVLREHCSQMCDKAMVEHWLA